MDKKFLPLMGLMAFVLLGQNSVNDLNAEASLPVRPPPTAAEIEEAYESCLKHECEKFGEWSIEAYEACSQGDDKDDDFDGNACQVARDLLAQTKNLHVGKTIYNNYVPDSFKEDDE